MGSIGQTPEYPAGKILSLLPELSRSLETGLEKIAPHFDGLGRDLQAVYAESGELTKGITASANEMTAESGEGLLHYIEQMVQNAMSVITEYRETISGSLGSITASSDHLVELCSICEKMKKRAGSLNVVGLNISVECSRTNEAREMFGRFGEEIKALAKNINNISATIVDDSGKVKEGQLAVRTETAGSMKTFDGLYESTKDAVRHAMEEMETIGGMAASTLETAGNHSREISNIVGEIVMSIQFHDIVRQKIEHVVSALDDILSLLDTGADHPDAIDRTEDDKAVIKGRIQSILALQAAHLGEILSEVQGVYENTQTAFGRIGNEVGLLMENVAASRSEHPEGRTFEQGIKNFTAKLENLRQLLSNGNELAVRIKETMDQSSNAVSRLSQYTDQVNNINLDLQYKAINAIIMTNKLGSKGATLAVLARSVRELSGESNTLVKEILDVICSITGLAGVSEIEGGERQENKKDTTTFEHSLEEGMDRINISYEQYKENCTRAEERSGQLTGSIEKIRQSLDFFPEWLESMSQVFKEMEDLLDTLAPWKDLAANLPGGIEDEISQRYTMESERRIHEQLTGTGKEDDHTMDIPDEDEDGFDDNIELF